MALTQSRLKELLSYDPETGHFHWLKAWGRRRMDRPAGCFNKRDGYLLIGIDRVVYQAHRLAWLYVHGSMPRGVIDHANGNGLDNRLSNLRAASQAQNLQNRGKQTNNTSGFKGVYLHSQNKRWVARITVNGRCHALGCYSTPEEAHAAYSAAALRLHGPFAHT